MQNLVKVLFLNLMGPFSFISESVNKKASLIREAFPSNIICMLLISFKSLVT
ncbi:hypothetical protein LEP1GSC196_3979 [Leptospira meyeri serovar Semaranga str. Veldrot Semarang 173]|nr:hypothetical protein LEP1GSC196_3979 [Leptospira meyeri serovar Semaranga str. Veldrot Semarang 173]